MAESLLDRLVTEASLKIERAETANREAEAATRTMQIELKKALEKAKLERAAAEEKVADLTRLEQKISSNFTQLHQAVPTTQLIDSTPDASGLLPVPQTPNLVEDDEVPPSVLHSQGKRFKKATEEDAPSAVRASTASLASTPRKSAASSTSTTSRLRPQREARVQAEERISNANKIEATLDDNGDKEWADSAEDLCPAHSPKRTSPPAAGATAAAAVTTSKSSATLSRRTDQRKYNVIEFIAARREDIRELVQSQTRITGDDVMVCHLSDKQNWGLTPAEAKELNYPGIQGISKQKEGNKRFCAVFHGTRLSGAVLQLDPSVCLFEDPRDVKEILVKVEAEYQMYRRHTEQVPPPPPLQTAHD